MEVSRICCPVHHTPRSGCPEADCEENASISTVAMHKASLSPILSYAMPTSQTDKQRKQGGCQLTDNTRIQVPIRGDTVSGLMHARSHEPNNLPQIRTRTQKRIHTQM